MGEINFQWVGIPITSTWRQSKSYQNFICPGTRQNPNRKKKGRHIWSNSLQLKTPEGQTTQNKTCGRRQPHHFSGNVDTRTADISIAKILFNGNIYIKGAQLLWCDKKKLLPGDINVNIWIHIAMNKPAPGRIHSTILIKDAGTQWVQISRKK